MSEATLVVAVQGAPSATSFDAVKAERGCINLNNSDVGYTRVPLA